MATLHRVSDSRQKDVKPLCSTRIRPVTFDSRVQFTRTRQSMLRRGAHCPAHPTRVAIALHCQSSCDDDNHYTGFHGCPLESPLHGPCGVQRLTHSSRLVHAVKANVVRATSTAIALHKPPRSALHTLVRYTVRSADGDVILAQTCPKGLLHLSHGEPALVIPYHSNDIGQTCQHRMKRRGSGGGHGVATQG